MKRIEKMSEDYCDSLTVDKRSESDDHWFYAEPLIINGFVAGYRQALRDAAIRGRLAQLENKVVDVEILALADQEASQ